ncbi:alpha/beta fold hydrolase [Nocardia sp. NPDC059177]|uniref:alpha/beta fold hydrolase n=1 Tax=Nocardia sp. NPDC059177 TaxID=3346759 RepID=UPI0036A01EFA
MLEIPDTPVLFVNAFGQGPAPWSRLGEQIAGHPTSLWTPALQWTGATQASELSRQLAALGRPVHLVAWCTGPKIALRVTARHPNSVASLVFLNPSLKGPSRAKSLDTEYESELEALLRTVYRRQASAGRLAEALNRRRSAGTSSSIGLPAELADAGVGAFHSAPDLIAYATQHLEFWEDDILADTAVRSIAVPITVISAVQDVVVSATDAADIARVFPQSESATVGGGHFSLFTHSDEVAAKISAHLASVRTRTRSSLPR